MQQYVKEKIQIFRIEKERSMERFLKILEDAADFSLALSPSRKFNEARK